MTTDGMLYALRVKEKTQFSTQEGFVNFLRMALLENNTLEGKLQWEDIGQYGGSDYAINRNYALFGFGEEIYSENHALYPSKPSDKEVFEDMVNNLKSFCGKGYSIFADSFGNFRIERDKQKII